LGIDVATPQAMATLDALAQRTVRETDPRSLDRFLR